MELYELEEMCQETNETIEKKKIKQKEYFDKKLKWSPFKVNDLVMVYDSMHHKRKYSNLLPK